MEEYIVSVLKPDDSSAILPIFNESGIHSALPKNRMAGGSLTLPEYIRITIKNNIVVALQLNGKYIGFFIVKKRLNRYAIHETFIEKPHRKTVATAILLDVVINDIFKGLDTYIVGDSSIFGKNTTKVSENLFKVNKGIGERISAIINSKNVITYKYNVQKENKWQQ